MPTVSIVIPTYNRGDLIEATLTSVLAQTVREREIIVVDDGSTDNTQEVLARYAHQIQVIRQPNQGVGAARNAGIAASGGDYIAFVDSDDLWLPTKLELQLQQLAATPGAHWVYSDAYAFSNEASGVLYTFSNRCAQYAGAIARQLLLCDFIPSPTPLIRRDVFAAAGLFDTDVPQVADWFMWLRIAATNPVAYVPKALAGYRVHQGMMTQTHSAQRMHAHCVSAIERAIAFAPTVYAPLRSEALARQAVRTGRMYTSQGRRREAAQMFASAARLTPLALDAYGYWLLCQSNQSVVSAAVKFGQWLRRVKSRSAFKA